MALACSQAVCQAANRACQEEQQAEQPAMELAPRPHAGGSGASRSQQRGTVGSKSQGHQVSINEGCFDLYKYVHVKFNQLTKYDFTKI